MRENILLYLKYNKICSSHDIVNNYEYDNFEVIMTLHDLRDENIVTEKQVHISYNKKMFIWILNE